MEKFIVMALYLLKLLSLLYLVEFDLFIAMDQFIAMPFYLLYLVKSTMLYLQRCIHSMVLFDQLIAMAYCKKQFDRFQRRLAIAICRSSISTAMLYFSTQPFGGKNGLAKQ